MQNDKIYDLCVIGGGPAGYTAAIRAAQLKLSVALCELEPQLGGTCLRIGCIPSKALLESSARFEGTKSHLKEHGITTKGVTLDLATMHGRKQSVVNQLAQGVSGLLKKHRIEHVRGRAKLAGQRGQAGAPEGAFAVEVTSEQGGASKVLAKQVLLAPGSTEAPMRGVTLDGDRVVSSTEALAFAKVPKSLTVIGAGAIGLELGSVWRRLGAKVVVLEYADRILPTMDAELSAASQKILQKQGLDIRLNTEVLGVKVTKEGAEVAVKGGPAVVSERVLVAVGRRPNTADLGLEALGIELDAKGRIGIGEHFETQCPGVFAIGDAVVGPMLAHKAEEEGVACVEHIVNGVGHVDPDTIAYIVYTEPEIASVGATEEALKAAKTPYKRSVFPFAANGRARAVAATDGFVKLLAHAETDRILGAHIVGAHAGDLLQEVVTAISFKASSEDLARTCHAHPTFSEAIKEAALGIDGRTLNM